MMKHYSHQITIDPSVAFGKPTIRGTRISVDLIVDLVAGGRTIDEIIEDYPHLAAEQIQAALRYAAARLRDERIQFLDNHSDDSIAQNQVAY